MTVVINTAKSETVHVSCSKTSPFIVYSNNSTTIRHNNIQTPGNPPKCFGLVWPSSVRYSRNRNTVISVYVAEDGLSTLDYRKFVCYFM